jgi:VIT1/CCC1 family predicted Fe2+/Mn2+ transporter
MSEKLKYFQKLYDSEMFHYQLFKRLSSEEKNSELKSILAKLSDEELKHSKIWGTVRGVKHSEKDSDRFSVRFVSQTRKIMGLDLTVKMLEYNELSLERELDRLTKGEKIGENESKAIEKVRESEMEHEDRLKDALLGYGHILSNIRNIIFGMNDGLVEVLGAVAGFAAALRQPILVIVAGLIVAIAGTLSMTGGAYLSVDYEKSIYKKKETGSSKAAAFYTGIAYIIGALVPLIPFFLGYGGYYALGISILVTAIVLTFVSTIISIVSSTSISRRIFKTLLISLGIVAITITLGIYARSVLHISI